MKTHTTRTGLCARLLGLALAGLSTLPPTSLTAGEGRWVGDDVDLHLYLEDRAELSEILGTSNGSWENYLRVAAQHYYDSHEGRSRIGKVYVYNGLPEGKRRADVWVGGDGPSAHSGGFGKSAHYLYLPKTIRADALVADKNGGHLAKSLAHEIGHYFYDVADVYGGQILTSGSSSDDGDALAVEYISDTSKGNPKPKDLNYREYMWSDKWLRHRAPTLQALLGTGQRVFYNLSGRQVNGAFPNDSLMGGNWDTPATMPSRDAEFATPASHVGPMQFTFKMPSYSYWLWNFIPWTRSADKTAQTYTLVNNQQWRHGKSDWSVISEYHISRTGNATTWAVPSNLTTQTLDGTASRPFPQVIIVGDSAIVLCLDRSGSMSDSSRLPLAKAGAQSAINLMRVRGKETLNGHFAGISSFSSSAGMNASIEEVTGDSSRSRLSNAVQALTASGNTNIGGGLRVSMDALLQHPEKSKAIILLSDGYHNSGENPSSVIPSLISNKVTVYTIAVGNTADRALLESIARQTGGESRVTDNSADLLQFFHDLFAKLNGSSSGTTKDVSIPVGGQFAEVITIERDCKRATFSTQLEKPWMRVGLRRPNGTVIDSANITDPTVTYQFANNQAVFDVLNPAPGDWKLTVDNRVAAISGGPFKKTESPARIVPDLGTATSPLNITRDGICNQLKVTVDIQHKYIGDLVVRLISPSGKSATLHNRSGGNLDNIIGTYGTKLVSYNSLSTFDGEPMLGEWKLEVRDAASGEAGAIRSWSLAYGGTSTAGEASMAHSLNNPRIIVADAASVTSVAYPAALPIRASVVAFGAPIAGARAVATVGGPDGSSQQIELYDDGDPGHGDTYRLDGIYSNLFSGYTQSGVYDVSVSVINTKGWQVRHSDQTPSLIASRTSTVPPFERSFGTQVNVTGVPASLARWFQLDHFQAVSNPTRPGTDSVSLKGQANIPPTPGFDGSQQNFGFTFGNVRGSTVNGSTFWKRAGRSNRWTYTQGTYSIVSDYFIGGSSKSTWAVNATKQNLGTLWSNPASVPVGFTIGQLSDTVNVKMDGTGTTWRMGTKMASPEFYVSTLAYTLNAKDRDKDALVFTGKVSGPFAFNPAQHSLALGFDDFQISIPVNGWTTIVGSKFTYRLRPSVGANVEVLFDTDKNTLSVRVDRADLRARMGNPSARITCALGGISGAAWTYQLSLTGNPAMTTYRY